MIVSSDHGYFEGLIWEQADDCTGEGEGEEGVEDLCLEMLLHIAPLSQFMYSLLGYFVTVVLEDLKVNLPATQNMPA